MALYIPHSIFHLARLLYVRPETFGPYYVYTTIKIEDNKWGNQRNMISALCIKLGTQDSILVTYELSFTSPTVSTSCTCHLYLSF